ncbi:2-keto-4-pentenoate hydratase [Vogesella indigofera]|uniref:2-keto-4-pentenoate hydratase n=1 Tax=Vogesella indigofera TaxID=45465 RepID=A0A495B5C1_VOGIN|nr:hypothetical protein [Vogesella indigofera]RKQ55414.1 2-keto-4-pentenoate hydratase [Vogesella indigofera]
MTPSDIRAAAIALAARRLSGTQGPLLADAQAPQTPDDALAIQQAVSGLLNDAIGGWKCGLPDNDKIVAAPIYATTIHTAAPCPVWLRDGAVRVEPELAFVFDGGLPLRAEPYTAAEIRAAITRVHLALELIDSRYQPLPKPPFLQSLADGLVNQGLLLGPQVERDAAFAANVLGLVLNQGEREETLAGVHPAGDPLAPLYWLQGFLAERGEAILPGQVVITGSYAGVLTLAPDSEVTLRYGELGQLSACFSAR